MEGPCAVTKQPTNDSLPEFTVPELTDLLPDGRIPGKNSTIPEARDFKQVIDSLERSIKPLRWMAMAAFGAAALILVFAFWKLPLLTKEGVDQIAAYPSVPAVAVYELFRSTGFAAVVTTVLWGLLTLGRACLDQATRFQKRLIAAHFLNYSLHAYAAQIGDGRMKLDEVMTFLKSWSENVESAFTNVKFGSRKQQDMVIAVTRDGATVSSGTTAVKKGKTPAESPETT